MSKKILLITTIFICVLFVYLIEITQTSSGQKNLNLNENKFADKVNSSSGEAKQISPQLMNAVVSFEDNQPTYPTINTANDENKSADLPNNLTVKEQLSNMGFWIVHEEEELYADLLTHYQNFGKDKIIKEETNSLYFPIEIAKEKVKFAHYKIDVLMDVLQDDPDYYKSFASLIESAHYASSEFDEVSITNFILRQSFEFDIQVIDNACSEQVCIFEGTYSDYQKRIEFTDSLSSHPTIYIHTVTIDSKSSNSFISILHLFERNQL